MSRRSNGRRSKEQNRSATRHRAVERLASLPADLDRVGAKTRSRFEYQDDCAALTVLSFLDDPTFLGVALEHSVDLVVLFEHGAKFVSIKHRSASRVRAPHWTWAALNEAQVFQDLYKHWEDAHRQCSVAFFSDAGYSGPALALVRAAGSPLYRSEAVRDLQRYLNLDEATASAFLQDLQLSETPLPRLPEIRDVAVRRVMAFLQRNGRDVRFADDCYDSLLSRIREASLVPSVDNASLPYEHGIGASLRARTLEAPELRHILLSVHDGRSADESDFVAWQADSLFRGREDYLESLRSLLDLGGTSPVPPVVLQGMPGIGKSAIALQFAALESANFAPIWIDGETRESIVVGLSKACASVDEFSARINDNLLPGPVAASLPLSSRVLVVIDGVRDRKALEGLIPRLSLARVIITTTLEHVDDAYNYLGVSGWLPSESASYICSALPDCPQGNADELGAALSYHPLAVAQAVTLCRQLKIGTDEYISRLDRKNSEILSLGRAAGYPVSLLSAITLVLDDLSKKDELCITILRLLALTGQQGLSDYLLSSNDVAVILDGEDTLRLPLVSNDEKVPALARIGESLSRDRAYLLIREYSLLLNRPNGAALHPLVARVAISQIEDLRPYLEVALACYARFLSPLKEGDKEQRIPVDRWAELPGMIQVVDLCLDREVLGPAVYAACTVLSIWILTLSGDMLKAERYARLGFDWAARVAPGSEVERFASIRLAQVLAAAGRVEASVNILKAAAFDGPQASDLVAVTTLASLANAVVDLGDMQAVRQCLEALPAPTAEMEPALRIRIGITEAELLLHLGEVERGKEALDVAIDLAASDEGLADLLWEACHLASSLARFSGDARETARAAASTLEHLLSREPSFVKSLAYVSVVMDLADMMISADELDEADSYLGQAEKSLTRRSPGEAQSLAGCRGIRGRLSVHRAMAATSHKLDQASPPFGRRAIELAKKARSELEAALSEVRLIQGVGRHQVPSILVNLAQAQLFLGDISGAEASCLEALAIDRMRYGETHPEVLVDMHALELTRLVQSRQGSRRWSPWA